MTYAQWEEENDDRITEALTENVGMFFTLMSEAFEAGRRSGRIEGSEEGVPHKIGW